MRLYLVRHAKAELGEPDEMRRLTPDGRAAARELGTRLAREGVTPDARCSRARLLRARETADEIARATGAEAEPVELLAPGRTAEDVTQVVTGRGDTVVIVGHQPDCGRIAAADRRRRAAVPDSRPRRHRAD